MAEFVLVWVLIVNVQWGSGLVSYSPPVKTLADCTAFQNALTPALKKNSQCVQVNLALIAKK